MGLEPTRPKGQRILSPLRLPIPPLEQKNTWQNTREYLKCQYLNGNKINNFFVMRKNTILITVFLYLVNFNVWGQIDIAVSTSKKQYLPYEAVFITIKLTNNSGRIIDFGESDGTLDLEVKNYNGSLIEPKSKENFVKNLKIQPGTVQQLELKLNTFYDIYLVSKYSIYIRLNHKLFANYSLKNVSPAVFRVTNGVTELKKNFGVSLKKDGKATILPRSYSVISYSKNERRYISLKIEDENVVYTIQELGVFVRGLPLQHQIDAFSNIHLIFHIGGKTFKYIIFSADGEERQRRYLLATKEQYPILNLDNVTGSVNVLNDVPAREGLDFQLN